MDADKWVDELAHDLGDLIQRSAEHDALVAELTRLRAENVRLAPRQRAGQMVFNAFAEVDPAFAETIRGEAGLDPYHHDATVPETLRAWRRHIESEMIAERTELDRAHALIAKQGAILTGVANALKGPPAPLTTHSHHDLAELAGSVVAERDREVATRVDRINATLAMMYERNDAIALADRLRAENVRLHAENDTEHMHAVHYEESARDGGAEAVRLRGELDAMMAERNNAVALALGANETADRIARERDAANEAADEVRAECEATFARAEHQRTRAKDAENERDTARVQRDAFDKAVRAYFAAEKALDAANNDPADDNRNTYEERRAFVAARTILAALVTP